MKNASEPSASPHRSMNFGVGLWGCGWWTQRDGDCGRAFAVHCRCRQEWRRCCPASRDRVAIRHRPAHRKRPRSRRLTQPQQTGQPAAAGDAAAGATLLDKITVVSRTGETAIETLASVSHVDQEQLDRAHGDDAARHFLRRAGRCRAVRRQARRFQRQHPRPAGFRPRRRDRRRRAGRTSSAPATARRACSGSTRNW